jgi:hypothetical protein
MPRTKISEFSATPASNTDIDSIFIGEGMAPSNVNDAIRELMAQLKDFQTGAVGDSFNGPVGTTTAAAGAFTTLSATGNVTLGDASTDTLNVGNGGLIKDASGNLGLGVTPSAWSLGKAIEVGFTGKGIWANNQNEVIYPNNAYFNSGWKYSVNTYAPSQYAQRDGLHAWYTAGGGTAGNAITFTQAMTLNSSGHLITGKTATTFTTAGSVLYSTGQLYSTVDGDDNIVVNRLTNDGNLIRFFQDTTEEGNISVSGTTVSYNGGHLSRWAQTTAAKDNSLVKGTVLSNLDAMNIYTDDQGNPVDNEQLNKVKVSDVEGDANVAGVFVNWSHDEDHNVDEINMAMTGDMIIRIAQGTTVQRGDLLMSAGNGTAKPQGDDIIRSKTVAKVTSNHVTCTYADGSYCVPCVLMAC